MQRIALILENSLIQKPILRQTIKKGMNLCLSEEGA